MRHLDSRSDSQWRRTALACSVVVTVFLILLLGATALAQDNPASGQVYNVPAPEEQRDTMLPRTRVGDGPDAEVDIVLSPANLPPEDQPRETDQNSKLYLPLVGNEQ